jgi:outer membrane lipoprotein SlyB
MTDQSIPAPSRARLSAAVLLGGAALIAVAGAGAGWMLRGNGPVDAVEAPLVASETVPGIDRPVADSVTATAATAEKRVPVQRVAPKRTTAAATSARTSPAESATARTASRDTPLDTQPAAICSECGVVESVRAAPRKGDASGVGAVAGGVVGAALGNQVGKGSGRTAMTVLGAVGGGLAGHEIEKRVKTETVYEVRLRMDDGTRRTVTRSTAPPEGARVVVEGETLRVVESEPAPARTMRTSNAI